MLRFSRPKGPGFGISSAFYLSVLSSRATLPSLLQLINPHGDGGAAVGFGVPLADEATKETLTQYLARGEYGLISKDKKTVIRLVVVSKDEVAFDTEAVARHSQTLGIEGELVDRIRSTWTLLQFAFRSHDPDVYPALDFLLALVDRCGALTDGAIADPVCERYLMPGQVFARPRLNPLVDAREHVAVHSRGEPGGLRIYTKGLQKFVQPEFEVQAVPPGSEAAAERMLNEAAQRVLEGKLAAAGQRIGKFELRQGGGDAGLWRGVPCLEFVPAKSVSLTEALGI